VTTRSPAAVLRSAANRRDLHGFAREARAAGPSGILRAWPRLRPVERVAAFRALDARGAKELFAALPADGKWLAYLGSVSEGASPLLEGASAAQRRLLRCASSAEKSAMKKAIL
jgi:hypothetical protein